MGMQEDLDIMKQVRTKLAQVYESQVNDGVMDNGNLTALNNAILNVNQVIRFMEAHLPE